MTRTSAWEASVFRVATGVALLHALDALVGRRPGVPRSKQFWALPEADHTAAIRERPREYERRVVGFLDDPLLGRGGR